MASEIEQEVLSYEGAKFASVFENNPITGQHTELIVEEAEGFNLDKKILKICLQSVCQNIWSHLEFILKRRL